MASGAAKGRTSASVFALLPVEMQAGKTTSVPPGRSAEIGAGPGQGKGGVVTRSHDAARSWQRGGAAPERVKGWCGDGGDAAGSGWLGGEHWFAGAARQRV